MIRFMLDMKYVYILIVLFLLASCDGTVESEKSGKKPTSASFKLVKQHIDAMGEQPWNKNTYVNIKNNQIPKLKRETEKTSASTHLKSTYGKVMVRDAKKVLENGCSVDNAHGYLNSIFKELAGFTSTPGYGDVTKLKSEHDKVLAFASSGIGNQTVTSYSQSYDTSYESEKMSKAKNYLGQSSVKCKVTRQKLQNLTRPEAYNGRRTNYCKAIVAKYLQCTNPAKREYNEALGKLNVYRGSKSVLNQWQNEMREHYNSLQPQAK